MPDTSTPTDSRPVFIEPDPCCSGALSKALARGLTKETWTHAKCGCEWRSHLKDGAVVWMPVTIIQIF